MMEADFWKHECNSVIYKGHFQTEGVLEYAIKREWSVQRITFLQYQGSLPQFYYDAYQAVFLMNEERYLPV